MTDPNRSTCSPYWNVLGDQILHFLEFFYYLLSHFENRWSNDPENITDFLLFIRICDFQIGLINSKKIPKNVKYGLQAHFNIEITSNGLDRRFGLRKLKNHLVARDLRNNWFDISQIYIYIYI